MNTWIDEKISRAFGDVLLRYMYTPKIYKAGAYILYSNICMHSHNHVNNILLFHLQIPVDPSCCLLGEPTLVAASSHDTPSGGSLSGSPDTS